ncbi:MAG TPA: hypothetical protein IAB58_02390 [Candidatus Pelethosoma merdigallinarum]|nr:hypothetical protein [Candidatus Pelethosoma merdigallinarum]
MDNLDTYLSLVNEAKKEKGLNDYTPLYPMLRVEEGKLYIAVLLVKETDNIWDRKEACKAHYWVLIDIDQKKIVEFNKTEEKDYVGEQIINLELNDHKKEMSMYFVDKALKYKEYLMNDIKNDYLPIQNKVMDVLKEIEIDGEKVNFKDYLYANIESKISDKINELVDVVMKEKYHSMIVLYENLMNQIITDYKSKKEFDKQEILLCLEIMSNYYEGIIGIDHLFNLSNK